MGARARPTVAILSVCETSTVQGHFLAGGGSKHKEFVTVMAFREVCDCEILMELKNVPLSTTVRWKNTVIRFWRTDCGEKCARQLFLSAANWTAQRNAKKISSVIFSIYLKQMHRFTLICCKIQRCLTVQRKLTLAESYDFLMAVSKGQYFFTVCQIPNYTLSYCQGTAPCGDVKYLAK